MTFSGPLSTKYHDNKGNNNLKKVMREAKEAAEIATDSVKFTSGLPAGMEEQAKMCFETAVQAILLLFSIKFRLPSDFIKYASSKGVIQN